MSAVLLSPAHQLASPDQSNQTQTHHEVSRRSHNQSANLIGSLILATRFLVQSISFSEKCKVFHWPNKIANQNALLGFCHPAAAPVDSGAPNCSLLLCALATWGWMGRRERDTERHRREQRPKNQTMARDRQTDTRHKHRHKHRVSQTQRFADKETHREAHREAHAHAREQSDTLAKCESPEVLFFSPLFSSLLWLW